MRNRKMCFPSLQKQHTEGRKWRFLLITGFLASMCPWIQVDAQVNITPVPKTISAQDGSLTLPAGFQIDVQQLGDSILDEVNQFVSTMNATTELKVTTVSGTSDALMRLRLNPQITNPEGYVLKVSADGVQIEASHCAGFFYAFQTLKKMLPANVMAGVKDASVTAYTLPYVDIQDEPRFAYRGFMLDVARHFFDVDEVKRVMDMMACYKMNKLHLHLSDDQGFRVEITKYPKLNTIGSIRDDSYEVDFGGTGIRFHTYKPYGPYYYTKEQIRELVAYAKKLHIDIIPEIDMPGHFGAAMAAYPEFSCEPNVRHPVISDESYTPTIPNVANPKMLQFAKDILSEIMDLFPYPYIHIGGDECDASHWERNAECMAFMKKMNFSHVRALQSYFTKEMADFVATRGYKLMAWNETITAAGSDVDMIKSTGADIVCWTGAENAAKTAYSLGLSNILAPQPTYYINRKQSADPSEPTGPGNGNETLEAVYNYAPANNVSQDKLSYYKGVQACMWTEYIAAEKHLEYLAFPRLMAVAESGWSPAAKKNFTDFCQRMTQDTVLFNYRGYEYGRHYLGTSTTNMVMPESSKEGDMHWYRLSTLATDSERAGRCMTLLHVGSEPVLSGKGQVNMLWSAQPVESSDAEYPYQLWAVKESPTEPGKYALVCQALPDGSVNPNATSKETSGRWTYDPENVHYNFILNDSKYYGQQDGNYYYSIRSDAYTDRWMNLAKSGQNLAVNVYTNPADSKAGLWSFVSQNVNQNVEKLQQEATVLLDGAEFYTDQPVVGRFSKTAAVKLEDLLKKTEPENPVQASQYVDDLQNAIVQFKASLGMPQNGQQIRITNSVKQGVSLVDDGSGQLGTTDNGWGKDVWTASLADNETDAFYLSNLNSKRYISGTGSPLNLSSERGKYKLAFDWTHKDFQILAEGDKALFPISRLSAQDAGKVYTGGIRAQGAAWKMDRVFQVTYLCCDSTGQVFQSCYQSVPADSAYAYATPEIKNWKFTGFDQGATLSDETGISENKTVKAYYQRENCDVNLILNDTHRNKIGEQTSTFPYQTLVNVTFPELEFYTCKGSDLGENTSFVLQQDTLIHVIYDTEAYNGFWELGQKVTEVKDGHQYVFYDATTVDKRSGFLNVNASGTIETTDGKICGLPPYVWTLEASGSSYKVSNENGKYMPILNKGGNMVLSDNGGLFSFTCNDGIWSVKDQNGLYWNGNVGSMTGWSDAHPYEIYEFIPYLLFKVTVNCVDEEQRPLQETVTEYVRAGYGYTPVVPEIEGYTFKQMSVDNTVLDRVTENVSVNLVYSKDTATGIHAPVNASSPSVDRIYNLQGMEIGRPHQGIYIQRGKKILAH